jgi:hypothetical protein
MIPFLKLEDYLAPPPLTAIIAVLMVLGILYLGKRLVAALYPESPGPLPRAACFIIVAALVAAAVHLLAFLKLAYLWPLRAMAWSLVILGALELSRLNRKNWSHFWRQLALIFQEQSFWGRAALVLLGITLAGFGLAALGPATDYDSLHYHLGVPLEVLRRHGAYPRPDWLFARLMGLGESLNMLGLAAGTDNLGACLQFAGLLAALATITSLAKDNLHRILLAMGVIGCPAVAALMFSQKPQMLPLAANTVALIMIARRFPTIDRLTLLLALGCVFFAMACKYTFLLTGSIVLGAGLVAAYRCGRLGWALVFALAGYLVFVFPGHWQNYLFYGDPISPLLERFRPQGDVIVTRFASYLKAPYVGGPLLYLLRLFVPNAWGWIYNSLGLGTLLIFWVIKDLRGVGPPRVFLICAFLAILSIVAVGQPLHRFLLEPYYWVIAAAATVSWRPALSYLFRLMVCQMLMVAFMAGWGAMMLFPGALTVSRRHNIMQQAAVGYPYMRWLDEKLPPDAVVLLPEHGLEALMPRPFFTTWRIRFYKIKDPGEAQRVRAIIASYKVNTLVAFLPWDTDLVKILAPYLGERVAGPQEFILKPRNPWNTVTVFQIVAFRLKMDHQGDPRKGGEGTGRQPHPP